MPDPAVSERVTSYPPAGLDRRFYAFAIDRLVAWPLIAAGAYAGYRFFLADGDVLPGIMVIAAAVLVVATGFAVVLGTMGTSPGRAAMGLRVVSAVEGGPIGVRRASLRTLVVGAAALPTFGLGLASLAWTALMDQGRQRRGWHDHLTHSIVVDVRPVAEAPEALSEAPRQVVNLTAMRLAPAPPPPTSTPPRRTPPQPAPPAVPAPTMPPQIPATVAVPAGASGPPLARPPAPLPDDPERTVVRGSPPRPTLSARWRVTFDDGQTFVLAGLMLVGRRPEGRPGEPVRHLVPLTSSDMSVSKTHAQLQVAPDGALVIMDRGSTNGSVLVRSGVTRDLSPGKPTTLLPGDEVRFGDRTMIAVREP
ncbi:RDD family protein [Nocardioides sp.]|uniref:RDD family protein n=1 Tax=Nocardioides sp. TaxID=35761 RepID=UPI002ED18EE7